MGAISAENNSNVEVFNYWSLISKRPILEPFFNLLLHSDGFIVHMSAVIISEIIAWNEVLMDSYDLHLYLKWIETELNKEKNPYLQSVIRCLQLLLRKNEYRIVFVIKDGISQILKVLQQQNNFQIEYQLIFCIWLLTFIPEIAEEEIMFSSVIPILIGTLNDTSKEKVIRIILAVLRNLISKPADTMVVRNHCIKMVKCKILKKLDILEKQDYKDEDIIEDLIFLIQQLKAAVHYLSSFDMYKAELTCGELEWTPVHKSTSFWEDNACRLNENCYELIQILINLLKSSTNPTVLSVACFDIGQYVQYCPNGKRVIEELDGKHIVMNLLEHENQHVRYEALVAVQKIMIQNWECLVKMMENDEPEKSEVEKMNQII